MTEIGLDEPQIDAGFEQVGGIGMTQGMNAGIFLDAAFLQRGFEGALDTALVHRLRGRRHGHAGACGGRKEPDGMAVGAPLLAQQSQRALRQRHVAVLVALAVPDMEHPPLAVNISDLQTDTFQQAQAARVNGRQAHAIVGATQAHENLAHLSDAEYSGQLFLTRPAWQSLP